jgi:hypothetical protein
MVGKLLRDGRRAVLVMEVEKDDNERTEQRGRRRDSETGAASWSKKKRHALARQRVLIYEGGGEERSNVRSPPATGSKI